MRFKEAWGRCHEGTCSRSGPLFGIVGVHFRMIRFCSAHNIFLGTFHRTNAGVL